MPSTVKVRIHGVRNLYLPYSDVYTTVTLGGHSVISEYDDHSGINDQHHNHHQGSTSSSTSNSYYKSQHHHFKQNSKNKRKCYNARTRVSRKLNSSSVVKWEDDNEFRFEVVDDTLLQDEPMIFKVMESEGGITGNSVMIGGSGGISAASSGGGGGVSGIGGIGGIGGRRETGSIGLVYIDLNPLLMKSVIMSEEKDGEESKKHNRIQIHHDKVAQMRIDEQVDDGGSGVIIGGGDSSTNEHPMTPTNNTTIQRTDSSQTRKQRSRSRSSSINLSTEPATNETTTTSSSGGGGSGSSGGVIDGWFPIYDPLEGVRGELRLSIKLNFIDNINPFRDSSAGVQLFPFSSFDIHSGYVVQHVFGFVEELVVAEDPEFEWNVLARSSHERRQTLMYLLDASVRRRMCKKVLEMGGNAVLG